MDTKGHTQTEGDGSACPEIKTWTDRDRLIQKAPSPFVQKRKEKIYEIKS